MIAVVCGRYSPDVVEAVQRFRGSIYQADGAILQLENGRHIERADATSFHLICFHNGTLGACLRLEQRGLTAARISGWAVAPELRGTRVAIRLALACVRLARQLGITTGYATATTRHGSADILKRLGGQLLQRYYDGEYQCEMEFLAFRLEDMRMPLAA